MSDKQIVIKRMELYNKVWSTPMSRLASDYGISDVGLTKICKRMEIPRPQRGYWQKLAAGKPPRKAILKPLSRKGVSQVVIASSPDKSHLTTEMEKPERIPVPETLLEPHPLVKKSLTALQKGKVQERGIIIPRNKVCLDIKVTRDSIDRACLVIDALIKALTDRGIQIEVTRERPVKTMVTVDGEQFEIGIDEKTTQRPHKATPEEKETYGPYRWGIPKYDYFSSGLLALKIRDVCYYGIRQQWADGKVQRIEKRLGDFITGLQVAARVRKERRIEKARQEEEWKIEQQHRAEMRRLAKIENKKIEKLQMDVTNWELANRVNAYVDALDRLKPDIEGISEWATWVRHYVKAINPLEHVENIVFDIKQYPYL